MRRIVILTLLALTACSPTDSVSHGWKVQSLRNSLPYLTRIEGTHSMSTVVRAGETYLVTELPYTRLQSGIAVVYWPIASPTPVCHFTRRRVGTDSWETGGMNQPGDIVYLGYLLTRENYIGVIK